MIDDKELRENLKQKVAQINDFPKSAVYEVRDLLANKYNVDYGTSTDIFRGVIPIDTLNYDMLFKLMTCIREINSSRWTQLDSSGLNADKYFTKQDQLDFNRPYNNKDLNKDIVIEKCLQVNSDQYVCTVPIEQLVEWRNINRIKYNPRTQRRLSEKNINGTIYKVITLFEDALDEIGELMESNEFISDDITFNIDPTYYEPPKIIKGNLIIPKDSVLDIIDGFHRLKKMLEIKDFDNRWMYNCIVNVTMFDESKANRFIIQRDKKNHLSEEQVDQMNQNSEVNFIINKLNESNKFNLKRTITDNKFDIIRKIIESLFKLDNKNNKKMSFQEKRSISVGIYNIIESTINKIVEEYNLYNTEFTPSMWFVGIYISFVIETKSVEIDDILPKINFMELSEKIIFKNNPTTNNYRLVKEVIDSVV